MTSDRRQTVLSLLRIVAAILMLAHGVARIYLGTVDDFGKFLTQASFPLGFYLAWAITLFEVFGSLALAAGYYASILSLIFAVHLFAGILLIHLKEGWFVVGGAGTNGAEYSVLLIAVFLTIAVAEFGRSK
jgi:putative oxidoreductase